MAFSKAAAAFSEADLAFGKADLAFLEAMSAFPKASPASRKGDVALSKAGAAFKKATVAFPKAMSAFRKGGLAFVKAEGAFIEADAAFAEAAAAFPSGGVGSGLGWRRLPAVSMKRVPMKTSKVLVAVGIAFVLAFFLAGEAKPGENEKMKELLISGNGFSFAVHEPEGWHGDTQAAERYEANIVFFPGSEASRAADVTIRVRLNEKVDENLAADLEADMEGYKKEFPGVAFGDLDVKHPSYATFAKVFSKPGEFFEYVTYLNPGPQYPFHVSVAMSKKKAAATAEELAAYREVLQSLRVLSGGARPSNG
ncbi:MAG TPA: hypothetical protein VGG03_21095 [Thermoanaerobaculia bacterium]